MSGEDSDPREIQRLLLESFKSEIILGKARKYPIPKVNLENYSGDYIDRTTKAGEDIGWKVYNDPLYEGIGDTPEGYLSVWLLSINQEIRESKDIEHLILVRDLEDLPVDVVKESMLSRHCTAAVRLKTLVDTIGKNFCLLGKRFTHIVKKVENKTVCEIEEGFSFDIDTGGKTGLLSMEILNIEMRERPLMTVRLL